MIEEIKLPSHVIWNGMVCAVILYPIGTPSAADGPLPVVTP